MNLTKSRPLWLCLATLFLQHSSSAADTYYSVPIVSLVLTEGTLPVPGGPSGTRNWQRMNALPTYAVLDGDGEVYIGDTAPRWEGGADRWSTGSVSVRAADNREITGRSLVPARSGSHR